MYNSGWANRFCNRRCLPRYLTGKLCRAKVVQAGKCLGCAPTLITIRTTVSNPQRLARCRTLQKQSSCTLPWSWPDRRCFGTMVVVSESFVCYGDHFCWTIRCMVPCRSPGCPGPSKSQEWGNVALPCPVIPSPPANLAPSLTNAWLQILPSTWLPRFDDSTLPYRSGLGFNNVACYVSFLSFFFSCFFFFFLFD